MALNERHEEYMTRRIREEEAARVPIRKYWNEMRLTQELQQAQADIKQLQQDMAYLSLTDGQKVKLEVLSASDE
jgi:hypothetical protein|tara:strand:+ start:6151 stop:6372 length:222 start_codon:yes stop_codon:yes gene_type:complete